MNILVTGAEGILGAAVTRKFLSEGHRVFGTFQKASTTTHKARTSLEWIQADLAKPAEVQKVVEYVVKKEGSIDAVVHCAGGFKFAKIEETSDADYEFLLESNLKSSFYVARAVIPSMKKNKSGRIVFIGSKSTFNPPAGMSAYASAKSGVAALTSALAEETKNFNINVNCVMPSIIDTPTNRKDMPKANFENWVTPDALADIIYSLTQTWGDPITGAMIPVNGRV